MAPYVQWGFAGFCFVVFATLSSINVWLMKNYIAVVRENSKVIFGNTAAISAIHVTADDTKNLMGDIRDQLLSRPCMLDSKRQQEIARRAAAALEHVAERAAGALDHVAHEAADALRAKQEKEDRK